MKRFFRLSMLAVIAVLSGFSGSAAQDYPNRVITLIVPFAPGGPTDALGRVLAQSLSDKLGQSLVVENLSGGGSTIGTSRVARAQPDGYTLLVHNIAIAANVSLYPKLELNPEKDLVPVGFINNNALVLVGRKDLPAKSVAELAAWMKSTPAKFAHPGVGTTGHLSTALFAQEVGAKIDYIPYRGGGPALQDVIAGHVDLHFGTTQAVLAPIKGGLVKAYGITSKEPAKPLPEVPGLAAELGPKLNILYWHALFAPAGTPKPVIEKLNAALQHVLTDPKILKTWAETGIEAYPEEQRSPEAAQALLRGEIERWGAVIRDNNIEPAQ